MFGKSDDLKDMRKWRVWKLKLIDARLYFVSIFVGLLTGLVAVPYHYLLQLFFNTRRDFFDSHPHWYWHIPIFLSLWGILLFVMWLVKKMPLITGGGIPQTRGVINGRISYKHPFIELVSKFVGGVLALSAGLSLGREGPSVQIGSYVGCLVSKWGRVLAGERKQLLAAGAGAGLAAAFAAPLASSLLVIESIERLLLAAVISVSGKIYSVITVWFKRLYPAIKHPAYVKMLYLLFIAYLISLTEVNLTGGGEQFLLGQAMHADTHIMWIVGMMILHFVFSVLSFSSGLPGGSFIPTLVTGGLIGQIVALILVRQGIIGYENISYVMLICMSAFLVAVIRTPLTAIVLITEITGHLEVFYPSIVVGGLTYYFTEMLQIQPFNVTLYDDMINSPEFQEEKRYTLSVEVMSGSYFDGKTVNEIQLPERCEIINIHRDRKDIPPAKQKLVPGDQVQIEMDAQDIEKLYEPLVSMANIY